MAPYREGYNPSVDQKDCPPELKVKLKGKASEWQERAKEHNKKSFEGHKTDISDITKAVDAFAAQSALENINLNADDRALLKYMRTINGDKPVDISIMQTMLRDVCDKTIAIDGRIGDQTIAAMKLAVEKLKNKIPGYRQSVATGAQIDAIMTPVIDSLPVNMSLKPAEPTINNPGSSRENNAPATEQIEKISSMSLLLKQHYPDMNLTIDGKGMLSIISSDKKTSQYIASIDTSKEADIMWNNIQIVLDEYIKKQNQNPENTGDKVPTSHEKTETQEQVDIIWYNGFTKASKYAESKGYNLVNNPSGIVAKDIKRPTINKIEFQKLTLVNINTKEVREIGAILPATNNIGPMKTSNAIATEIQALIDKSLAQKQETPNTSINLEGIDPKYHEQFSGVDQAIQTAIAKASVDQQAILKNFQALNRGYFSESKEITADNYTPEMIAQLPTNLANEARHQKAYLLIKTNGLASVLHPDNEGYLQKLQIARTLMNEITNPTDRNNEQKTDIEALIRGMEEKLNPQEISEKAQERIGDLIITDANDILIIQEMKAKGITMSKSNGKNGGIDIKKGGDILYTINAKWGGDLAPILSTFLKNNRELLKKDVQRIGGTIFSREAIQALGGAGFNIKQRDFGTFDITKSGETTLLGGLESEWIESVDYNPDTKRLKILSKRGDAKELPLKE